MLKLRGPFDCDTDITTSVEWLQQNIEAFGGDPSRMTLWGQSAGAMSVDFYNFAHYTNPIVQSLIMDSGTAFLPIRSQDASHSNFSFVAANVGCGGLESEPATQLDCMRNVSAATLEGFLEQYQEAGTTPAISFVPIADEKTIFSNYTDRALKGLQAKIVRHFPNFLLSAFFQSLNPVSSISLTTRNIASDHRHQHPRRRTLRPLQRRWTKPHPRHRSTPERLPVSGHRNHQSASTDRSRNLPLRLRRELLKHLARVLVGRVPQLRTASAVRNVCEL